MKVSIQKYNPNIDVAPHMEEYEVPESENLTVLKAIIYIHENIEPIAFDYSCRGRVCGRCAMMLNGEPCMACTTALKGDKNVIEPLAGFRVIKDLVVDKTEFHDRITNLERRVRADIITEDEIYQPVDYENVFKNVDSLEWCARCGCCQSVCPVVNSPEKGNLYVGPSGMVAIALRYFDPYDKGDRVTQAVQEGLWNCIMCGKCDEVCPAAEIDHQKIYKILRDEATLAGLTEEKPPYMPFG